MAIIPLRVYNREIEGMVDNGQLDEAVAHCRHILATFPKHIATYRLLGKAHLEQQRISDAIDIFQRVLSAIPDDFIANVGMSIIREDENNLDASIWHMELAYEAQPSNVAIQDELRRLYGRRDGVQPPKVRLTRGALAKMYAKGGLFDQAIAELRAAIDEDPNRPDLQLLLAQMFFQTFQRTDAVETCANIVKKLPLCLVANQILAVTLPEAERSDARRNYRQIAITMDPYFAFAEPDAISSDKVLDDAVNIERLDWKPGLQMSDATAQPTWATSLGVSLEKPAEEKLPDWLKDAEAPFSAEASESAESAESGEKSQPSVSPFIWDTQEVEKIITDAPKQEEEIPDWMKDAGWEPALDKTAHEPEQAIPEQPSSATQPEENLEQADIPDWLRGIAPEGLLEGESASPKSEEGDTSIPWLEKQQPGPTDSIIQWLEDKKPETPATPEVQGVTLSETIDEDIPDWLKDLDVPLPASTPVEEPIKETSAFFPESPVEVEEPVFTEPIEQVETKSIPSAESFEQIHGFELISNVDEISPVAELSESDDMSDVLNEDLPDWLKELAIDTTESTVIDISQEDQKVEAAELTQEEPGIVLPEVPEEVDEMEVPAKGEEISIGENPFTISEELAEEDLITSVELPSIEIPAVIEETIPTEVPSLEEVPDTQVPIHTDLQAQIEQPGKTESELVPEIPVTPAEAESLTWLEELTGEQGAEEEELNIPSLERLDAQPEWVNLDAEAAPQGVVPEQEPQEEERDAIPAVEIPDWIKGLGETPELEAVTQEPALESIPELETPKDVELPSWLEGLEPTEEKREANLSAEEALEWKEDGLPDWLKEIAEEVPSEASPTAPVVPFVEQVFAAPTEPIEEWTTEEVPIISLGEEKVEEPVEPAAGEPTWVPEFQATTQPLTAEPVEAEGEPAAINERDTKALDTFAVPSGELPVPPVIEDTAGRTC